MFCGAVFPHQSAGYTSVQGFGFCGGMKRFAPDVSAPYGIPRNCWIPRSTKPRTFPLEVATTATFSPTCSTGPSSLGPLAPPGAASAAGIPTANPAAPAPTVSKNSRLLRATLGLLVRAVVSGRDDAASYSEGLRRDQGPSARRSPDPTAR